MPELRDMELLAALARQRHFARAAAECGISQPAFSARIRNLELDLGAPIIKRGNRFLGFTLEGEIALKWAHQMIAGARSLRQEVHRARGVVSGRLVLGVVPTALTFVADFATRLHRAHPDLNLQILSRSSTEIAQGLEDFSLDAGFTYLESPRPAATTAEHVYDERYSLLVPQAMAAGLDSVVTWRAAAALPLCLLTRNMLNRQILDNAFEAAGVQPQCIMETNAFTVALIQVMQGVAATIAPELLVQRLGLQAQLIALPLTEPAVEKAIGVVVSDRQPLLPTVDAMLACLRADPR